MAFIRENILSGFSPQIPTISIPETSNPVVSLTMYNLDTPRTPYDCVAALAAQDEESYADWAATEGRVVFGARQLWSTEEHEFAVECTAVDATEGTFTARIPTTGTDVDGIFLCELDLFNKDDVLVMANFGYLEVIPSLSRSKNRRNVITIARIRRLLRDTHPEANKILEECEFSIAEIHDAIVTAVESFNELPPILSQHIYTIKTFPYPIMLEKKVIAELLRMAARWYVRNQINVKGAGFQADDLNKGPAYIALADAMDVEWERKARSVKRQLNISGGWGTNASGRYASGSHPYTG